MADFPPNLEDGEMWLPSDIFVSDVDAAPLCGANFNTANYLSPPDQLSRSLPALSPHHHQPLPLRLPPEVCLPSVTPFTLSLPYAWLQGFCSSVLQWYIRPFVYISVTQSPSFVRRVGPVESYTALYSYGLGNGSPPRCRYQCHLLPPAESQVNGYSVTTGGGRFFRRPFQTLFQPANHQGRFRTLSGGGTGVFLPRVPQTDLSSSSTWVEDEARFE